MHLARSEQKDIVAPDHMCQSGVLIQAYTITCFDPCLVQRSKNICHDEVPSIWAVHTSLFQACVERKIIGTRKSFKDGFQRQVPGFSQQCSQDARRLFPSVPARANNGREAWSKAPRMSPMKMLISNLPRHSCARLSNVLIVGSTSDTLLLGS